MSLPCWTCRNIGSYNWLLFDVKKFVTLFFGPRPGAHDCRRGSERRETWKSRAAASSALSSPQCSSTAPALLQTLPQTSCPLLPVNKTQKCLNSVTWGNIFQQITLTSDFKVLIFITAASLSAANLQSVCTKSLQRRNTSKSNTLPASAAPPDPVRHRWKPWRKSSSHGDKMLNLILRMQRRLSLRSCRVWCDFFSTHRSSVLMRTEWWKLSESV